jgi:hypothetical protein
MIETFLTALRRDRNGLHGIGLIRCRLHFRGGEGALSVSGARPQTERDSKVGRLLCCSNSTHTRTSHSLCESELHPRVQSNRSRPRGNDMPPL